MLRKCENDVIQPYLILSHLALLHLADITFFTVYGNPALSKPVSAIFPTELNMSVSHFDKTSSLLLCLL
jgi:hypothetical protein